MLRLTACAAALLAFCATAQAVEPPHATEIDEMIARQAKRHGVPEKLVRRVVMRESRYNPRARNHSFWGLMQISYPTARSMGFRGSPNELLDPLVNLTYAVPYLANAFIIAGKQEDAAVRLYASGYYNTAKNHNRLDELRTADSTPLIPDEGFLTATAKPVSNLIAAVVNGPPDRQQVASAGATIGDQVGQAASAASAPEPEPEVTMAKGSKGYTPPAKWVRDGGVTLIAKGEQRIDQVAAYHPGDAEPSAKRSRQAARGKTRKNTEFASLDAPPSAAQAYAAGAAVPEGAAQTSVAQAAIAQATAPAAEPDADPMPAKPTRSRRATSGKTKPQEADAAAATDATAAEDGPADPAPATKKAAAKPRHVAAKKPAPGVAVAAKAEAPPAAQ